MWPNPKFSADLFAFTEEILNGELHFFVQWTKIWLGWMNFNSSDKHHTTTFHFMALWINSNIFSFRLREREDNDQVTFA